MSAPVAAISWISRSARSSIITRPTAERDRDERPGDAADQIEIDQARAAGARSRRRGAAAASAHPAPSPAAGRRPCGAAPTRSAPGSAATISARKNQSGLPSAMLRPIRIVFGLAPSAFWKAASRASAPGQPADAPGPARVVRRRGQPPRRSRRCRAPSRAELQIVARHPAEGRAEPIALLEHLVAALAAACFSQGTP